MTLWIDDREPAKVIAQLKQLVPDAEMRRMDVGDYVIGDFAVERKTIPDLMGSVFDTRYWKQLANLKNTYPHPCVLIEGTLTDMIRNGKAATDGDIALVNGVKDATIMSWSIPIVQSANYIDTAAIIAKFYARSEKKSDKPRAVVKKEQDPDKIRVAMLQVIDGMGPMGASRVLSKFKLCDLVEINDPTVYCKNVVGMNRKVAERIVKVFNYE